jgi:hypothetical protein
MTQGLLVKLNHPPQFRLVSSTDFVQPDPWSGVNFGRVQELQPHPWALEVCAMPVPHRAALGLKLLFKGHLCS